MTMWIEHVTPTRRRVMARKPRKVWQAWRIQLSDYTVTRTTDGAVRIFYAGSERCFSPTEARRLFLALKKDYLD